MKRLSAADYAVDAVTAAKLLLGKWLCPGRVTKFLQIDRTLNREPLATSRFLWIEDGGTKPPRFKATPRIGIAYATKRFLSHTGRNMI